MNLEMPTPAETESLRKLLLIVLGVMIVTIPVIGILVVAKIKARQRAWRPPGVSGGSTGVPPAGSTGAIPGTEGTKRAQGAEDGQENPDIRSGSSASGASSEASPPPHA